MSISEINLLLRSETDPNPLEHSEVDANWQKIQDWITEVSGILNNILDDQGQFVPNSVSGFGLKDASVPTVKLSQIFSCIDTGSSNSIKITLDQNVSILADNMIFFIEVAGANTGETSIEVFREGDTTPLGSGPVYKKGATPLEIGDIATGTTILVAYKSQKFFLINTLGSADPEIKITTSHSRYYGPVERALNDESFDAVNEELAFNHGLGGTPTVDAVLICKIGEHGYVSGDEIPLSSVFASSTISSSEDANKQQSGIMMKANKTQVKFFRVATTLYIPDFLSTGDTRVALTNANWALKFTASYVNPNTRQNWDQRGMTYNFGDVRTAMTDGNNLYVIDAPYPGTGGTATFKPRLLNVNLNNNNISAIGSFGDGKSLRWNAIMSVVPWNPTVTFNPPTTSITAADPVEGKSVVTVVLGSSLTLVAGDEVYIQNATPSEYNGVHVVTEVVDGTTFKFELTADPGDATAQGTVEKVGAINRTIAFIDANGEGISGASSLRYISGGALSGSRNVTTSSLNHHQVLAFTGSIAGNFPNTFYSAQVGGSSTEYPAVSTQGHKSAGSTTKNLQIYKFIWNDVDSRYDISGSPKALDLIGGPAYSNRNTFTSLTDISTPVVGVCHNPVKRRLYVITQDRLCHIFDYTDTNFGTFFDNGSWGNTLSYVKSIGITGGSASAFNDGTTFARHSVSIDFDPVEGTESNIIQAWGGVPYNSGGIVTITPWVE